MKNVLPANPDEEVFTSFGTIPSNSNCSDDPLTYECLPCQAEVAHMKEVSMPEVRDFMSATVKKIEAQKAQRAEDKRIAALVVELGKAGKYVLNERPEGMSFEDYKIVRARLNKFKQNHIHAGTPVHKSAQSKIGTDKNGRPVRVQDGKGVTYRKPFEVSEEFERKLSAPQPDPLTQQLSK